MAESEMSALESWLAEVEAEIVERQILAGKLRERLGIPAGDSGPGTASSSPQPARLDRGPAFGQPGRFRPDEFFGMSIPEAIKAYLGIMKQPQGPKAIVEGLRSGGLLTNAKHFYANVATALKRLRVQGQVTLTPNGWGLSAWYPNRAKLLNAEGKKGRTGRRKRGKSSAKRRLSGENKAEISPNGKHEGAASVNSYRVFVGEAMKAGKTMAQAAEEWKRQKAGAN
jgi:hypothetical protein